MSDDRIKAVFRDRRDRSRDGLIKEEDEPPDWEKEPYLDDYGHYRG